ncbi:MAG TPA: hypothetical protein EYQ80_00515, partial [Candidatus Poseidoniales archaeon]|nr:hypothetical protein [Candidatus Poseidoniales archaeon]
MQPPRIDTGQHATHLDGDEWKGDGGRMLVVSFIAMLLLATATSGLMGQFNLLSDDVPTPLEVEDQGLELREAQGPAEANGRMSEDNSGAVIAAALMVTVLPPMTLITVGVLYVWANSLASPQPDESGTRNSYTADDAAAGISTGNTDTLMSIRWQHAEDDLNWAFVIIKLTVGDTTHDCTTDGMEDCAIGQDGDDAGLWQVGEFLTLSENAA